jgi:2-hydroxycyclohexanecarboxyl-CoA dehydrogenase
MRRVVVTGGCSGIGAATAKRFADAGDEVIRVDIDAAADRVCDVSDADAVRALAHELGDVDVLVNNAGVGIAGPFLEATLEDWQWLRSINLDGVVHGCHAFGPGMLARGSGQIVNVASAAAYLPQRHMAAYCATKAAVVSFSQCLRADWRTSGVGVSVVCPGVINTPIAANSRYFGRVNQRRAIAALRRGHSPDLVARAIVDCVKRNRDVVPVGFESTLAYKLLRGAPQPIQGLIARAPL